MTRYLSATEDEAPRERLELVRKSPQPPLCAICGGGRRHKPGIHGAAIHWRDLKPGDEVVVRIYDLNRGVGRSTYPRVTIRTNGVVRLADGSSRSIVFSLSWFFALPTAAPKPGAP